MNNETKYNYMTTNKIGENNLGIQIGKIQKQNK